MPQVEKIDAITKYLLGELSDEERDWVETQMLADEEFLDQCMSIEDRLVDDYVLGHLDQQRSELFEKKFLTSPRRRAKLELAQSLLGYAETTRSQPTLRTKSPAKPRFAIWQLTWAPATAWAMVLIALGTGLWAIHSYQANMRLQSQLTAAQAQTAKLRQTVGEDRAQQTQTAEELEQEKTLSGELHEQLLKADSASRAIATLALLPSGFRSEGNEFKAVVISPEKKLLRLELGIEPGVNYQQYRIALQHSTGEAAVTLKNLRLTPRKTAEGEFLTVTLQPPASGDYILTLEGKDNSGSYELVSSYNFHITTK